MNNPQGVAAQRGFNEVRIPLARAEDLRCHNHERRTVYGWNDGLYINDALFSVSIAFASQPDCLC